MNVKLTLSIPEEFKERMDRLNYINWNEVILKAIEGRFMEEVVSQNDISDLMLGKALLLV